MFVLIAGGGRRGSTLARYLLDQHHDVVLVEHRPEVLAHLHRELPTETIFEGVATQPHVLEEAGIHRVQVAAACMVGDADNLVLCYLARKLYGVGRTIACINDPRAAWLFDDAFHVDVAVNQSDILAKLIEEEMSLGDMMTLLKLRRGQFSLVEEKIPPGARAIGMHIRDLPLPPQAVIAAVLRKGTLVIPRGDTVLQVDDEVLAIVHSEAVETLAALLGDATPG